jgi:hypothetical protein
MRKVLLEMVGFNSEAEWDRWLDIEKRAHRRAYMKAYRSDYYQNPEKRARSRDYLRAWRAKRANKPTGAHR